MYKLKNLPQTPMQPAAPLRSTIYRAGRPFSLRTALSRLGATTKILNMNHIFHKNSYGRGYNRQVDLNQGNMAPILISFREA